MRLDRQKLGRITKMELVRHCQDLGYEGSVTSLWDHYTGEKRSHVTLNDIDAKAASQVEIFASRVVWRHGTLDLAWKELDPRGADVVHFNAFSRFCTGLGEDLDANWLFRNLSMYEHSKFRDGTIVLSDLEWLGIPRKPLDEIDHWGWRVADAVVGFSGDHK